MKKKIFKHLMIIAVSFVLSLLIYSALFNIFARTEPKTRKQQNISCNKNAVFGVLANNACFKNPYYAAIGRPPLMEETLDLIVQEKDILDENTCNCLVKNKKLKVFDSIEMNYIKEVKLNNQKRSVAYWLCQPAYKKCFG